MREADDARPLGGTFQQPSTDVSTCHHHPSRRAPKRSKAKITLAMRFAILLRDGFHCRYCGACPKQGARIEVDHIRPVARGGRNDPRNLITSCWECNAGKRHKVLEGLPVVDDVDPAFSAALREFKRKKKPATRRSQPSIVFGPIDPDNPF